MNNRPYMKVPVLPKSVQSANQKNGKKIKKGGCGCGGKKTR
ncbi:hypothetical protein [Heyndrickxia acidiproducens]|nr:hypothetical protein [Heyndrickxia acidiproducens]